MSTWRRIQRSPVLTSTLGHCADQRYMSTRFALTPGCDVFQRTSPPPDRPTAEGAVRSLDPHFLPLGPVVLHLEWHHRLKPRGARHGGALFTAAPISQSQPVLHLDAVLPADSKAKPVAAEFAELTYCGRLETTARSQIVRMDDIGGLIRFEVQPRPGSSL